MANLGYAYTAQQMALAKTRAAISQINAVQHENNIKFNTWMQQNCEKKTLNPGYAYFAKRRALEGSTAQFDEWKMKDQFVTFGMWKQTYYIMQAARKKAILDEQNRRLGLLQKAQEDNLQKLGRMVGAKGPRG